ncbi:MAG: DHH family phosphoesterase, partial [Clostridiales bacterium]|nr:DHH family phosphoesterase [Clostridiales bacterium]
MNHAVTYVIGHKNPDTDTICSAIAYARLKEILTGRRFVPKRAGQLNGETRYVLRRFGVKSPGYLDTLEPRVSDIQIQETGSLAPELTLKEAWEQMLAQGADTQPVVVDGAVRGMVSAGDIACFYLAEQNLRALSASG